MTTAIHSMTGFASGQGAHGPWRWTMELRSVNGKGLDLRLRLPDWIEGLEPAVRARIGAAVGRGNLSMTLRVTRDETAAELRLNEAQLLAVIGAIQATEQAAARQGLALAPSRASDVLAQKGVMDAGAEAEDTAPLRDAILADLGKQLEAFAVMRASEGEALRKLVTGQLDEIQSLTATAAKQSAARAEKVAETLRANMARVLDAVAEVDEARLAQELALLAVKSDVTEEIDRLNAHVEAARDLVARGGMVGRKLDFLCQEFNREANTLCSKAQMAELTQTGLSLKLVIDQMREQVQNME